MNAAAHLQTLVEAAIGENGFIAVMARKSRGVQQDIPAAFDAYALLSHFLDRLPVKYTTLTDEADPVELVPAIRYDPGNGRVLAIVPIGIGELEAISYWCTISMMSATVKRMAGLFALPFSLETHAGAEILIPEWCASYFVDGKASRCIPILTMRAMLSQGSVGTDWVEAALARLRVFALPVSVVMISDDHLGQTNDSYYGLDW